MYVNEWISYECSDEGPYTPNIRNSSTRSHASEGENRRKNCKPVNGLYGGSDYIYIYIYISLKD